MHSFLLALFGGLASFSVPDPASWRVRLDLVGSSAVEIPGADDFHRPETGWFEVAESRASASQGMLRLTARTPELHRLSGLLGGAIGEASQSWSCLSRPWFGEYEDIEEEARMTVRFPVAELVAGVEYHPWRRHLFALEAILPLPLGSGDLEYTYAGETIHSGKAPSSFRQAVHPRLMATWDYRLLDRIDMGLGMSLLHGSYFAEVPEASIDSLGPVRLDHGDDGPWIELHLGWTFGRSAP